MTPNFDSEGRDIKTFSPFILHDCRATEWKDVRLEFSDWNWLHGLCGGDSIGDYYLNGPGVEGLVMAARFLNGLEPQSETINPNSEGDACYIHFTDFDEAVRTGTERSDDQRQDVAWRGRNYGGAKRIWRLMNQRQSGANEGEFLSAHVRWSGWNGVRCDRACACGRVCHFQYPESPLPQFFSTKTK